MARVIKPWDGFEADEVFDVEIGDGGTVITFNDEAREDVIWANDYIPVAPDGVWYWYITERGLEVEYDPQYMTLAEFKAQSVENLWAMWTQLYALQSTLDEVEPKYGTELASLRALKPE